MFSKNIRIIYLYLIALVSLGMIIGGTVASIRNITEVLLPEREINYLSDYEKEEYDVKVDLVAQAEATKIRNIKNVIYSFLIVGVGTPLFLFNWKQIEKERSNEREGK